MIKIIGIIIGVLISVAGIYYLVTEKEDKESKKIYSMITLVGIVVLVISFLFL